MTPLPYLRIYTTLFFELLTTPERREDEPTRLKRSREHGRVIELDLAPATNHPSHSLARRRSCFEKLSNEIDVLSDERITKIKQLATPSSDDQRLLARSSRTMPAADGCSPFLPPDAPRHGSTMIPRPSSTRALSRARGNPSRGAPATKLLADRSPSSCVPPLLFSHCTTHWTDLPATSSDPNA